MMISIQQTVSKSTSQMLEVKEDGLAQYRLDMTSGRSSFSADLLASDGERLYRTVPRSEYLTDEMPYSWLRDVYSDLCFFMDRDDHVIGAIQQVKDDRSRTYYIVGLGEQCMQVYEVFKKQNLHLLILYEGRQIGQIEKWLAVSDFLDQYALYLLDEYVRFKELLVMFTGYYDNREYPDRRNKRPDGKIYIGDVKEYTWTLDFNKSAIPYDRNWLPNHFPIRSEHQAAIDNEEPGFLYKLMFLSLIAAIIAFIGFILYIWVLREIAN